MATLVNKKQLKAIGKALNAIPVDVFEPASVAVKFYTTNRYGISGAIFYDEINQIWYAICDRTPDLFKYL